MVLFWKIESTSDSLYPRRHGCSNVDVAINRFAPPGAAVGVATGGCFATRDLARLHGFVGTVCLGNFVVCYAAAGAAHHFPAAA